MFQIFKCIPFFCLFLSIPLFCYTCVFPSLSPLYSLKFPTRCPPGQLCLSSKAVGQRGMSSYEKSGVLPAFTFTSDCCDTVLCKGISSSSAFIWPSTLLSLLLTLFYSQ
uniref:Ly6 domain containing, pigment cell n=1 Tax=Cyprinus carpio TaxID=7962 RepID=A0A8C1UPT3_CYPCA